MFKRTVVLKPKKLKGSKLDCEAIILFTLFLCGIIIGVFVIKNCNDDIKNAFCTLLRNYISAKSDCGFLSCFSGTLVFLVIFVVAVFLLGMCAVGTPLVWCVPVIFGLICSGYVSLMLISYGIKGILYFVLVDLLPYAITTAVLVRCCCESTGLSVNLFTCIAGDNSFRGRNAFKEYAFSYLILCVPVIMGALISAVCFKIFEGLFIFA